MARRPAPITAGARPRGSGGYADLLFAHAAGGTEALTMVAELLGYRPGAARPAPSRRAGFRPESSPQTEEPAPTPPRIVTSPLADIPVWYPRAGEYLAVIRHGKRPPLGG